MKGILVLSLLLGLPLTAAAQDPANVDASHAPDPLNISARQPATKSSGFSLPSFGRQAEPRSNGRGASQAYTGRAEEAMPSLSNDDYRQAYGTSDIRNRLGRVYNSGGGSGFGSGLLGSSSWMSGLSSGLDGSSGTFGSLSDTTQPIRNAMDEFSRQLMPALQEMRNNVDTELNRASRNRK